MEIFGWSIGLYILAFAYEYINAVFIQHLTRELPWKASLSGMALDFMAMGFVVSYVDWLPYALPVIIGGGGGTLFRIYQQKAHGRKKTHTVQRERLPEEGDSSLCGRM